MKTISLLGVAAFATLLGCGGGSGSLGSSVTVPAITRQPATQTAEVNGSVTFSVTATGSSLTYQWQKDGTAISGATDRTYTLSPVVPTDAGSYAVVVTNTVDGAAYSTTSSDAVLTVSNTGSGSVTVD